MIKQIYDDIAESYDEKYVVDRSSSYMFDEFIAGLWWSAYGAEGRILSLGCGTGQDVEILNNPKDFVGLDISNKMLEKAREKFPDYSFIQHDCNELIDLEADVLVSMFGTPNYIGINKLKEHMKHTGAKNAFFVFYDENYQDGVAEHYTYNVDELKEAFNGKVSPLHLKGKSNYNVVII